MLSTTRRSVIQTAWVLVLTLTSVACVQPKAATAQAIPAGPGEVPTVALKGTVVGAEGQPVPEVQIGVICPTVGGQTLDGVLTGKCNQAGAFEVVTPDVTRYYGSQAAYCILARNGDGTLMGAAMVPAADLDTAVQIELRASGYIHSSILNPKGQPVVGMGALLVMQSGWVPGAVRGPRTDELGQILIGPLPAGVQIGVDVASESRHLVAQNVWQRKNITLQPGETYELPPLTLDPEGRSVEGVLADAEGKPLPGAQVACYLPQWPPNVATADEQGRFRLARLPVQGYDVWLIAADTTKRLYVMSPVDPDAGGPVRLGLRPLTEASGLLAGADGQALAGIPVRVFPTMKAQWGDVTVYTVWNTQWVPLPEPVRTGEDGSWQISGLIAGGMYSLQPETPGARLDLDASLFEVSRDGKPTDCGLMMVQ